jgi:haloalkane dehalogenase
MSAELRALYQLPYDSWKNRIATLRFVQDIPLSSGDPAYDLVSSVADGIGQFSNLPMLICWGELDFVFDKKFLAEWRERFPYAEVHSYQDCGHYILEDAREEIIPLICSFLDRKEQNQ